MLTPDVRTALLEQARQERRARSPHAPYLENDLQAFVERNFVGHLADWFGMSDRPLALSVRVLGAQVPCAAGLIDVLAMIGDQLVIVELKAQPVTERTVGQVLRYKTAVEDIVTRQLWRALRCNKGRAPVVEPEVHAMCMVIGPSFDPNAETTLCELGWPLLAVSLGNGNFAIHAVAVNNHPPQRDEPELERLAAPVIAKYLADWQDRTTGE